jgi:hypothetical protein
VSVDSLTSSCCGRYERLITRSWINLSPRTQLLAAGAGAAFIGLLASPLADADTGGAYADISSIFGDAITFDNAFGSNEDALFLSDLTSSANLFSASGIDLGIHSPQAQLRQATSAR